MPTNSSTTRGGLRDGGKWDTLLFTAVLAYTTLGFTLDAIWAFLRPAMSTKATDSTSFGDAINTIVRLDDPSTLLRAAIATPQLILALTTATVGVTVGLAYYRPDSDSRRFGRLRNLSPKIMLAFFLGLLAVILGSSLTSVYLLHSQYGVKGGPAFLGAGVFGTDGPIFHFVLLSAFLAIVMTFWQKGADLDDSLDEVV